MNQTEQHGPEKTGPEKTGTTIWYRSPEVWLVLSPLVVSVLAMLITIVVLHGSGALEQHDNLGKPLGKVHTGEPG